MVGRDDNRDCEPKATAPKGWAYVWPPPSRPSAATRPPHPWLDGFQMLGSQKRPLTPPKATALASS